MPRIPVVDENDVVIGHIDRNDRDPNDIIRISAVWITDEDGNILLQQRKLTKKNNPGKWGPAVAGTVEEGETYIVNAYKEMKEEIGVEGVSLFEYKKYYGETNTGKRFCQVYTATIPRNTRLTIEKNEVEQVKWFTKAEVQKMISEHPDDFVGAMKQELKNAFL